MITQCPICSSGEFSVKHQSVPQFPTASIVKCKQCNHLYTYSDKDVSTENLYNDEVYKVVENRDSIFDKILNFEYSGVVDQISWLEKNKGTLLDFGCGKGKFGSLAQQSGWKVKCVETAPDRAAYAREVYKLDVSTEFYSSGKIFNIDFDVLTLFHVLEHLPAPEQLLRQLVKDNVRKNGLVLIEVPNIESLQSSIAGNRWIHLDVPRHINHFTQSRLEELLRSMGLNPVKQKTFSVHLGILGMLDSLLKKFGYRKNIIYELKNRKNPLLLIGIGLMLPFAIILESIASLTAKGGIIRFYCINQQ